MGGRSKYLGAGTGLDQVPLRDSAQGAPGKARTDQRVVKADEPIPVWVWLVIPQRGDYRAEGEALGWTSDQVWVRYRDQNGREGFVWVWANAARRR